MDAFSYEDYQGDAIELIYSHIFGSIHCGCTPEQVCNQCGDGQVLQAYGETCDLGSRCPDGTDCSMSDASCPGICEVIVSDACTSQCRLPVCGDGVITSPNSDGILETCDDGLHCSNYSPCEYDIQCQGIGDGLCIQRNVDGCNSLCQIEACGDGSVDYDGADNIRGTSDDEACDDGVANANDAPCMTTCQWNPDFAGDPGVCGTQDSIYTVTGGGTALSGASHTLCDTGTPIGFEYIESIHSRRWTCEGIQGAMNQDCDVQERRCGDGTIDFENGEYCDDGNALNGDGCSSTCQLEGIVSVYPENGSSCHANSYPLVTQPNEIVPLTRELQLASGVDKVATSCSTLSQGTFIPGGSIMCTIRLDTDYEHAITVPCLQWNQGSSEFFYDLIQDYNRSLPKSIGGTIFPVLQAGKHRFYLENISYEYCDISRSGSLRTHSYQECRVVCEMPVSVIEQYSVEKGSTLTTKRSLKRFLEGTSTQGLIDQEILDE